MSMKQEQTKSADFELAFDVAGSTAPESFPAPRVPACLIEYASGRRIALPPHTVYALVEYPEFVGVPGAVHYAYGLLTWQDTRLPLLDLNALLHADQGAVQTTAPLYALVVAYQSAAYQPLAFGAIGLGALPQTITVSDNDQYELPTDSKLWPQLALSCFKYDGYAVPILDTSRLFFSAGNEDIKK